MRHWLKDAHFRSMLKNSSYLAASKGVAAVAGIATLAFAGRGLGVALFGMLILITSYAKAASGISKFQSWQLIVRYGGSALATGQHDEFKASTGFAFALDVVSGVGGMIVAVMILPFVGKWFGITDQYLWLATALLHVVADHGRGNASRGAARAGSLRPDQLARHDLPDRPRDPRRDRLGHARTIRRLCRDLVRHRSRRRHLSVVPGVARIASAGVDARDQTDASADDPARGMAVCNPRQPDVEPPDGLGSDRAPDCRRTAGTVCRGPVPRGVEPRRQRPEARGFPRQGVLPGDRPDGSRD